MLAGRDGALQQLGAKLRGGGVEEDFILTLQRCTQIGGPSSNAVLFRQLLDFRGVAPHQDRIRHHARTVLQRDAALLADLEDRADQMLVHAHAPGDAVHDDAETLLAWRFPHLILRMASQSGMARLAKPGQSSDFIRIIPPLMRRRTAPWLCSYR